MKILILTVGLPRSGKSTWSRKQGNPIVNPDSIRLALYGQSFIEDAEPMIWCIAKYMVKALFLAGHNKVILDATNLTKKGRAFWESREWTRQFKFFNASKEECIKRAILDNRRDLLLIIVKMDEETDLSDILWSRVSENE